MLRELFSQTVGRLNGKVRHVSYPHSNQKKNHRPGQNVWPDAGAPIAAKSTIPHSAITPITPRWFTAVVTRLFHLFPANFAQNNRKQIFGLLGGPPG
jgi:hypothetical protein